MTARDIRDMVCFTLCMVCVYFALCLVGEMMKPDGNLSTGYEWQQDHNKGE